MMWSDELSISFCTHFQFKTKSADLAVASRTFTVSISLPPIHVNMCGWLMKKSTGLLSAGTWKRKWLVLCGSKLWHYESPWHMEHVKSFLICANVVSLVNSADMQSITISFNESDKSGKVKEKTWELKWDSNSTSNAKQTWNRRLTAAVPVLLKAEVKKLKISPKKV